MARSGSISRARIRSSRERDRWCRFRLQTIYSMETIGDKPSLRFETNIAKAKTLYPQDVKPPELPGRDLDSGGVQPQAVSVRLRQQAAHQSL